MSDTEALFDLFVTDLNTDEAFIVEQPELALDE